MLLEENAHERLLNAPERHQKGNQELFKINSSIFLRSFIQSLTSFRHWVIPTHLQGVFAFKPGTSLHISCWTPHASMYSAKAPVLQQLVIFGMRTCAMVVDIANATPMKCIEVPYGAVACRKEVCVAHRTHSVKQ